MQRIVPAFPIVSVRFGLIDVFIIFFFVAVLSLIVYVASGWRYEMPHAVEINLNPTFSPLQANQSHPTSDEGREDRSQTRL